MRGPRRTSATSRLARARSSPWDGTSRARVRQGGGRRPGMAHGVACAVLVLLSAAAAPRARGAEAGRPATHELKRLEQQVLAGELAEAAAERRAAMSRIAPPRTARQRHPRAGGARLTLPREHGEPPLPAVRAQRAWPAAAPPLNVRCND